MPQFLRDITVRRMLLCVLLVVTALVAALAAFSIRGLSHAEVALQTGSVLRQEAALLSLSNDQLLRARLRIARQKDLAAAGDAARAGEEMRSSDAALSAARKHFEA
ncbi:MAG: Tar ligand binding domain-containing protein, partial [Comamonas sp.]